ncbi:MAG TPA: M23 family metallopeptidase [Chitinophagaceae bacterium]
MKKIFTAFILILLGFIGHAYINIKPTPSLSSSWAFPVWGKKTNIGSFWGDARDGGKRKHEGIDIFAKRGTPVVAVYDGVIVSKSITALGGKNLWLQSTRHSVRAYYAHLDEQKVKAGQFVKKGQVIGTVGNTGNAKKTPPHLHFGIYKWFSGAIDPLPYVMYSPKILTPESNHKINESAKKKDNRNGQGSLTREQSNKTITLL